MFEKKGEPTPCRGCENEPPEPDESAALFEEVYGSVFAARDGDGSLRFDVLKTLMDIEGIAGEEQAEIIRAAIAVESKVTEARSRKLDKQIAEAERKKGKKR